LKGERKKMEKETIKRQVELAQFKGAEATISGQLLTAKGAKGQVTRNFSNALVRMSLENGTVKFETTNPKRKAKALIETYVAHTTNMLIGVTEGFTYRMEIVQSHFPSKVTASGDTIKVENFNGEKDARIVKLEKGVKIKVEGKDVFLSGADLELVAKSAQKLEDGTKIKRKDRRTFQDGIYIMERKIRGGA